MIDVVPYHHLPAAVTNRPLLAKLRSRPVLAKRHCRAYPHCKDAAPCGTQAFTTHPDDPIANGGPMTNLWLAGGKGADTVKGVRSEPKIPIHHIDVAASHLSNWLMCSNGLERVVSHPGSQNSLTRRQLRSLCSTSSTQRSPLHIFPPQAVRRPRFRPARKHPQWPCPAYALALSPSLPKAARASPSQSGRLLEKPRRSSSSVGAEWSQPLPHRDLDAAG